MYIDRYILLFSCTCARVHFSHVIVQLVKKLSSKINFLFVRFFVSICPKKKNARILCAILLISILLKIKECGIHIIVVVTGKSDLTSIRIYSNSCDKREFKGENV